jgi:hypothetical protein
MRIGKIDTTDGHRASALPERMNCFSESAAPGLSDHRRSEPYA